MSVCLYLCTGHCSAHNEIVWHHIRGCTFTYAWDIHTQTHARTHTHTHIHTHTLSISVCYSPESVCLSVSPVFLNVCPSLLVSVFLGLIVCLFVFVSFSLLLFMRLPLFLSLSVALYAPPFVSVSVFLCLSVSISVPAHCSAHNEIVWHHRLGCIFTYAWDIHTPTHAHTHTLVRSIIQVHVLQKSHQRYN